MNIDNISSSAVKTMTQKLTTLGQVYVSYGQYHYNMINKLIHIIFVPAITFTLIEMMNCIPAHIQVQGFELGLGHMLIIAVNLYYLSMSPILGALFALISWSVAFAWSRYCTGMTHSDIIYPLLAVHMVSWIMQFVGHGVFEKRKPALLDSATQVFSAPMFVVIEVLMILGIKGAEWDNWEKQIAERVAKLRSKAN